VVRAEDGNLSVALTVASEFAEADSLQEGDGPYDAADECVDVEGPAAEESGDDGVYDAVDEDLDVEGPAAEEAGDGFGHASALNNCRIGSVQRIPETRDGGDMIATHHSQLVDPHRSPRQIHGRVRAEASWVRSGAAM